MPKPSPEKTRGKPEPVDIQVGLRIRMRRALLEITQMALAEAIGVTFQQVQKYEKGTNRVGASRLQQIADALDVPVAYFFEDMPGGAAEGGDSIVKAKLQPEIMEFMSSSECLALVRAFSRITDERVRSRTIGLVKAMAEQDRLCL
ncbi:helix-turn-helix transcriptional regulator [Sinorhizobium sp. 7-81]|uniref:helix-turn-helix domain-containing protein n=1 Tax=Sinorhizobium sp. 8-89 TaxID=3049089 RepID=UPI0024C3A375|nr:helix-turn-helix transcriptional regulator [Sinorhizobium sp. 8-89]MDK1494530.1 helix-turn-helix transcriptional regulator [Sinorhizobium sp. 8-89]